MSERTLRQLIAADCRRYHATLDPGGSMGNFSFVSVLFRASVTALALYRLSHHLHLRGWFRMAGVFYRLNLVLTGADIHPASRIGSPCRIAHTVGTVIQGTLGDRAELMAHVVIQPEHPADPETAWPVLGDDVLIGSQVAVVGSVHVASRVSLSPCSLIDRSIEVSDCVVSAMPGRARHVARKERKNEQAESVL